MSPEHSNAFGQRRALRPVKLINAGELNRKIDQRRRQSEHMENTFRRQCTGAYWRYASGIYSATGEPTSLHPQTYSQPGWNMDITTQPTQQLGSAPTPKITDKLPAYHEPCSDSFDIRSLQIPISLEALLHTSIQEHARIPDGIRMNPAVITLLKMMDECCDGRYKGLIPLVPDPELDANSIGIDYL
jgi:hypothetical protein